jgi:hypothetical protein
MTKHLVAALILAHAAFAGESSLTVTYQPLDGLGSGSIHIAQVTCHDWYSHSGQTTQLGLISAPNVPPTNNRKEATENLNLASVCGLGFGSSDLGDTKATLELTMVATGFNVPERFGHPREDIIRASLECLRLCLPERLKKTAVTLTCREADKPWMEKIVSEFNAHDRTKVFFTPMS